MTDLKEKLDDARESQKKHRGMGPRELKEYAESFWPKTNMFAPLTRREEKLIELMCLLIAKQGEAMSRHMRTLDDRTGEDTAPLPTSCMTGAYVPEKSVRTYSEGAVAKMFSLACPGWAYHDYEAALEAIPRFNADLGQAIADLGAERDGLQKENKILKDDVDKLQSTLGKISECLP